MKIDVFSHVLPKKYKEAILKIAPSDRIPKFWETMQTLYDLDRGLQIMDRYEGLVQVLTIANPLVEALADPKKAVDLAKLANDEMAEIIFKYPDKFAAAVACLPMNNMDSALGAWVTSPKPHFSLPLIWQNYLYCAGISPLSFQKDPIYVTNSPFFFYTSTGDPAS